jgi:hypothetical protein
MKKIYFTLLSMILLASCQKDEISTDSIEETIRETAVQNVTFDELPDKISKNFDGNNFIKYKSAQKSMLFGAAKTNIPAVRNINKNSKATYTIALHKLNNSKSANTLYFDNYVAKELEDGRLEEYVIRYLPNEEWYNQKNRALSNYTGEVIFYNLEGIKLGKTAIYNGKAETIDNEHNKGACVIRFERMICSGLFGNMDCVYEYRISCSSGAANPPSGGDNYSPNWGDGDSSGDGTGGDSVGDSDSGAPGSVNTNPIINDEGDLITVECPPGEEPNIFGVCEKMEEIIKIDRDSSFLNLDKINCTYERLMEQDAIPNALADFFGDARFDVTFTVVEDLNCNGNTNATGCNTPLPDDAYRIDIDKDYINDPNTPTIFLAQTLIHESFHAKLFAEVKKNIDSNISNDIDFKELYNKYRQHENWDHEMMAEAYTEMMQTALKEVHPQLNDDQFINHGNSLDPSYWNWDKFYEVLSYRGLQNTESGIVYYSNNEEHIRDYTNDSEALSTKNPNCNE